MKMYNTPFVVDLINCMCYNIITYFDVGCLDCWRRFNCNQSNTYCWSCRKEIMQLFVTQSQPNWYSYRINWCPFVSQKERMGHHGIPSFRRNWRHIHCWFSCWIEHWTSKNINYIYLFLTIIISITILFSNWEKEKLILLFSKILSVSLLMCRLTWWSLLKH